MIHKYCIFALIFLQFSTVNLFTSSTETQLKVELKKYMKLLNVPGASIALVHKDGRIWKYCNGYSDLEKKVKVNTETLFPIGSSTKPFTTFLIAKYVDQELLCWDTPLYDLIPNFSLSDRYLTYHLTLREALTHQSGLPRFDGIWVNRNLTRTELKDLLQFVPSCYRYREDFIYQNNIFMLGALALEEITGKSYENLIREEIFEPLQMDSSNLSLSEYLQSDNRASGYHYDKIKGLQKTHLLELESIAPSAAINSNLDDLCKWSTTLLHNGNNHISLTQWKEMTSFQIESNIFKSHNVLTDLIYSESYGLGWYILDYRQQQVIMHSGHVEGFSSNIALFPDYDLALVVLSNAHNSLFPYVMTVRAIELIAKLTETPIDTQIKQIFELYDDKFKAETIELQEKPYTHPLIDYTGTYSEPAFGSIHLCIKNSQLFLNFHDLEMSFKHSSYNTFSVESNRSLVCFDNMKILFNLDFSGNISSLTMDLPTDNTVLTFKKALIHLTYEDLDKFIGSYQYNNWNIKIIKNESGLGAIIQNAYTFILKPETQSRFSTPDHEGYIIEFKEDKESGNMYIYLNTPQNEVYSGIKIED